MPDATDAAPWIDDSIRRRQQELATAITVMPTTRVLELDVPDDEAMRRHRAICSCGWSGAVVLGGDLTLPSYDARRHMREHLQEPNA